METLESAYDMLSREIKPLETEIVDIQSSVGRVVSHAVMAPSAHPRFPIQPWMDMSSLRRTWRHVRLDVRLVV